MALESRPFIGTYQLDNHKVVKHTPDALVYFNGDTSLPGCPTCGGRIDLQKYLTEVSVDPSTEGPSTASISLHIPKHAGDGLFRDGNFIIRPGIEVHVYMRGFFPVKGLVSQTADQTGGSDLRNSVMYPYYLVFHGVVTEVGHQYASGEHTASLSCADLLHFWQYIRMSTNAALLGARPTNSKVRMSLVGNNFTGMSPFAILYTLYRDVAGAAGGVEFALGNETNAAANSTVIGESLFSLTILYWQKRFSQTMQHLRMYGADGTLYSNQQAAFLASLKEGDLKRLQSIAFADKNAQSSEKDPMTRALRRTADAIEFPYKSVFQAGAESDQSKGTIGVNVAAIDAFVSDVGNWGNVNMFQSEYKTKLEVANIVKEAVGFEFYQDVDGDLVFKPPFYNLDTSSNRVYRLEPIDIISFNASEKEPECTVVKATGSWSKNLKIPGLEGEWGTRAQYVDYRLVAQFGWREQTIETAYHTDPRAMFFAAISRFDLFNIGINSATVTIPIRPELRPGYPIYVSHLDCFYYIQSFSHSMAFGGQCTTTINLVGKRSKFYAPGKPPASGNSASIDDIDLGNPHLPALPIEVAGQNGLPRLQGFPNVVMTLDPERVNPLTFARGVSINDIDTEAAVKNLIDRVLFGRNGVLQVDEDRTTSTDEGEKAFQGPFKILAGNGQYLPLPDVTTLLRQAQSLKAAYDSKNSLKIEQAQAEAQPLVALVTAVQDVHDRNFPDQGSTAAYLELLSDYKAAFSPGVALPGYYRYYSSCHPDPAQQGPLSLDVSDDGIVSTGSQFLVDPQYAGKVAGFTRAPDGTTDFSDAAVQPTAGIPIRGPSGAVQVLPTHAITSFQVAHFEVLRDGQRVVTLGSRPAAFPAATLAEALTWELADQLRRATPITSLDDDDVVGVFQRKSVEFTAVITGTGATPVPVYSYPVSGQSLDDLAGDGEAGKVLTLATIQATELARTSSEALFARHGAGVDPTTLASAWASLFPDGFVPQDSVPSKEQIKAERGKRTVSYPVPVFPVSDQRGYQVVGTFRYGRGLSVEPGGNFEQISRRDAGDPSNTDYETIETSIRTLLNPTAESKAVKDATESLAALAATTMQAGDDVLNLTNVVGREQIQNQGGNTPSNTNQSTQKISAQNAAYSLADLGVQVDKSVCACMGAEADVLLEAFNTDLFVDVGDTDTVQTWLEDRATEASIGWAASQNALRGTVVDTGNSAIASGAAAVVEAFGSLFGSEGEGV